jgi:type I restriction enzyme, S subunit
MLVRTGPPLPRGWKRLKFGDCAEFINGRAYAQDELLDAGTPVLRIQNLTGGDRWYYSNLKLSEDKYCEDGDLLFAWSASFGPYIWKGPKSIFHYHIWRIIPRQNLDKRFAYYLLDQLTGELKKSARGIAMLHLTKSGIEAHEISLPPLDEQRRIAAILDQTADLRRRRRQGLEKLEALLGAEFSSSFVSVRKSDWPEVTVAELSKSTRTGPFGSQLLHSEFTSAGIAVLGIDNAVHNEFTWDELRYISEKKYSTLQKYRVFPRDVIITIMGTCGRAAIVPDDIPLAISTKHLCCLTLDKNLCVPEFLHACFLRHPSVLHQLGVRERGAVMAGLNMGLIKEIKISLPPLNLQRAFAVRIQEIGRLKASHLAHLAKLDLLFASLQYRAFRGELSDPLNSRIVYGG